MEAKLKILTKQYDEVGTVDTIEVDTIGKIFEKNKDIYVVYEEIEEDQKITTTVRISDDEVSIKRFGIIETETNKLVVDKSEKNYIKLNIEYNINILDLFKGKNEINILIEYNI